MKLIYIATLLSGNFLSAQNKVGINTTNPITTLDVRNLLQQPPHLSLPIAYCLLAIAYCLFVYTMPLLV